MKVCLLGESRRLVTLVHHRLGELHELPVWVICSHPRITESSHSDGWCALQTSPSRAVSFGRKVDIASGKYWPTIISSDPFLPSTPLGSDRYWTLPCPTPVDLKFGYSVGDTSEAMVGSQIDSCLSQRGSKSLCRHPTAHLPGDEFVLPNISINVRPSGSRCERNFSAK